MEGCKMLLKAFLMRAWMRWRTGSERDAVRFMVPMARSFFSGGARLINRSAASSNFKFSSQRMPERLSNVV